MRCKGRAPAAGWYAARQAGAPLSYPLAGMRRSCSVLMPALHVARRVRQRKISNLPCSPRRLWFDVLNVRASNRHRAPAAVAAQAPKLRNLPARNDLFKASPGAFAVLASGYRFEEVLFCFHSGY